MALTAARGSAGAARSRGMTLPEVVTTVAIIALLTSMAVALYVQASQHFARTSTDLDAEREARAAMGYVAGELRQAMPPFGQGGGVPVVSPTAPPTAVPSPTPTSQVVFYKVRDIASAIAGTTLSPSSLEYDQVVIAPDPSATPPAALIESVSDPSGALISQKVIGEDVQSFAVTPISADAYDVTIVTAPRIRTDLLDPSNPGLHTYALSSTVFISYFKTNL